MIKKRKQMRKAGILCPVSSLPGDHGIGDFGQSAKQFADWLYQAGYRCWEVLPLGPTSFGNSPYQPPSSCSGNYNYISAEELIKQKYLTREELEQSGLPCDNSCIDYGMLFEKWNSLLRNAVYPRFAAKGVKQTKEYKSFCRKNSDWLEDYALFMAIKAEFHYKPWWEWPKKLANYEKAALAQFAALHKAEVGFWKMTQFIFFQQWFSLKSYVNQKGIEIMGDMPFYVAADSADVWSRKELFAINMQTNQVELWAGVPSDIFSDHDRNWGNPVYRWEAHKADHYSWFRQRIRVCASMYDSLRFDHGIGVMRYYGIKEGETKGSWYDGPDMGTDRLLEAIHEEAGQMGLEIIAEDLGCVPPGLREYLQALAIPGMRVMQFAYVGKYGAKSNHLPFYHTEDMVIYTGTHDNPTLKEFLEEKTEQELRYMKWWTGKNTKEELHWALIEETYKSHANQAIIPIQDILGLGKEARIVFHNDYNKSWLWKMQNLDMLNKQLAEKMRRLAVLTGRIDSDEKEFFTCLE